MILWDQDFLDEMTMDETIGRIFLFIEGCVADEIREIWFVEKRQPIGKN